MGEGVNEEEDEEEEEEVCFEEEREVEKMDGEASSRALDSSRE